MNRFRELRELRNMSLEDVCEKLNYSRRVIEQIENDKIDFADWPYNYYCAKTYSNFLGFKIPPEDQEKFK